MVAKKYILSLWQESNKKELSLGGQLKNKLGVLVAKGFNYDVIVNDFKL